MNDIRLRERNAIHISLVIDQNDNTLVNILFKLSPQTLNTPKPILSQILSYFYLSLTNNEYLLIRIDKNKICLISLEN